MKRKTFSEIASFPAQILTGIGDPLSGFFAVAREKLIAVNPDISGYKICFELLLGQKEILDAIEVPICFRDRQSGTSKMSMNVITSFLSQTARLCTASIPSSFLTFFALLMGVGVTDTIVYSVGIFLKATLFFSHVSAFICSIIVLLLTSHISLSLQND